MKKTKRAAIEQARETCGRFQDLQNKLIREHEQTGNLTFTFSRDEMNYLYGALNLALATVQVDIAAETGIII